MPTPLLLLAAHWSTLSAAAGVGAMICGLAFAGMQGIGSWLSRRSGPRDQAREEALALAQTRGEAIEDLHRELGELTRRVESEQVSHDEAMRKLHEALELSRAQALETQQMLAAGVRGLLVWCLGQLEKDPPRIDIVVLRIREALAATDPAVPGVGRRRT